MNTKFTKGKWVLSTLYNSLIQIHSNGVDICEVDCNGDYIEEIATINPTDEELANAHLIAAAPDMYTMIGELTDMVDKLNEGFNADHKAIELSIKAESLLAKARGEL